MAEFEDEKKEASPSGLDNPYVAAFETGKTHRVLKSYMFLGPLTALGIVIVVSIISSLGKYVVKALDFLVNYTGPFADFIFFAILIVPFVLRWFAMSYAFEDLEFEFNSGVFTKKHTRVPYVRIQAISYHASPIQRIFRACTVTIDCAAGSGSKSVRIPYVKIKTAQRMRVELAMRKAAVEAGKEACVTYCPDVEAAFGNEPISYEYKLRKGELFKAALTNEKPVIVAIIVLFVAIIVVGVALLLRVDFIEGISALAMIVILAAVAIVWVGGLFPVLFAYGNCHVRRRGTRIEVERGVVVRDYVSIDISHVQSIEVNQTFVRRLFKNGELAFGRVSAPIIKFNLKKIFSLVLAFLKSRRKKARKIQKVKGVVVHPCMKLDQVEEVLANLAPEFAGRPHREECKRLPSIALPRAIFRECFIVNRVLWFSVILVVVWIWIKQNIILDLYGLLFTASDIAAVDEFEWQAFIVVCVVVGIAIIARLIGAILWARRSGYTWNDDYLLLWNDGLSTDLIAVPRRKIHAGLSASGFLQRQFSIATLTAFTIAGGRGATASLYDVSKEDVDVYLDWLRPRQ